MTTTYQPQSKYKGPHQLEQDATAALNLLASRLSIQRVACRSHSLILIENYGDKESLLATAVYLVSAITQNIEANLELRKALFNENNISRELLSDVVTVVGDNNQDQQFNTMVRNPWTWEAISHMIMHLSRLNPDLHPSGRILAKTSIKYDVHDHGLDVIAIYEATGLGLSAGECKAYLSDPSRGISDASNKLGEIDANIRDIEMRAAVNQLRSAIDENQRGMLAGAFWKNERSYLPFVCCDEEKKPDWTRNRSTLKRLAPSVSHKLLIPISLPKAAETFDFLCDRMREYASLEP